MWTRVELWVTFSVIIAMIVIAQERQERAVDWISCLDP